MTKKVITFEKVYFQYRENPFFALKNINLEISNGEFVLLVGYSGSGKSTLLKCINGLIPHFYGGKFGGIVTVLENNTLNIDSAQYADKVGFVFQNPENQLSTLTVEREIAFPLENFGIALGKMRERIDELIGFFGLEDIRKKSPYLISGGEQQLVALAAALALDPPILILDEALAHLSPQCAQKILYFLEKLNKKYHKTIILSEHRLDKCLTFTSKVIFLEQGQIRLQGSPQEIFIDEKYPFEMLPQIPKLFLKMKNDPSIYKQTKFNERFSRQKNIPLNVNEMVNFFYQEVTDDD